MSASPASAGRVSPGLRRTLYRVAALTGVAGVVRALTAGRGVSFFIYHDPAPDALDRHLSWLGQRYTFVSIGEACDALEAGVVGRLGRWPAVLTLDDGRRGNAGLVDVLRRHGVRPCLYLCSGLVGSSRPYWDDEVVRRAPARLDDLKRRTEAERRRALSSELAFTYEDEARAPAALSRADLAALAPHVDFGSHGRFHQPLRFLSGPECQKEITVSKREIEALVGRPCEHFALPSGAYDQAVLGAVAAAGYRSCRTAQPYANGEP
ncbi:MAG TPA: polysaccharide deacetylase family protein, partial [Gemmatimonadales bacterium]